MDSSLDALLVSALLSLHRVTLTDHALAEPEPAASGIATKAKLGSEHYRRIGRIGGEAFPQVRLTFNGAMPHGRE